MSLLEARGIRHAFPGSSAPVLDGISFTVSEGECVVLTGPSGGGKSTLARILAGHLVPTSGSVLVADEDRTGKPGRSALLIHQENDLFPWLKVRKQIAFAMRKPDEKRIDELLKLVKLEGSEALFPNELSGGMKKRLALARALAADPRLLILDESFASLDDRLRRELSRDLKEIWERTRTTLLVITHHQQDIEAFGSRHLTLSDTRPATLL